MAENIRIEKIDIVGDLQLNVIRLLQADKQKEEKIQKLLQYRQQDKQAIEKLQRQSQKHFSISLIEFFIRLFLLVMTAIALVSSLNSEEISQNIDKRLIMNMPKEENTKQVYYQSINNRQLRHLFEGQPLIYQEIIKEPTSTPSSYEQQNSKDGKTEKQDNQIAEKAEQFQNTLSENKGDQQINQSKEKLGKSKKNLAHQLFIKNENTNTNQKNEIKQEIKACNINKKGEQKNADKDQLLLEIKERKKYQRAQVIVDAAQLLEYLIAMVLIFYQLVC